MPWCCADWGLFSRQWQLLAVKNLFRHRQTRYRGLAKNTAQLYSLFGLANLVLAKHELLAVYPG